MGITINGSSAAGTIDLGTNGTITDLAAGGLPDNTVDGGNLAMGSDAAGDILYYNGTDYIRLPKGTDGQVLKLASGVPAWSDPDLKPWFDAFTDAEQTFSANTHTVMTFGEVLDSGSMYDTSNNRFTPTVAGTYFLEASMVSSGNERIDAEISIRKNGSKDSNRHSKANKNDGNDQMPMYTSMIVTANGSSDYFDVYGWYWLHTGSGNKGFSKKHFRGFKIG